MRQPTHYPIGSISSGTMRPEDLIPTFCTALERLAKLPGIVSAKGRKEHLKLVRDIESRMESHETQQFNLCPICGEHITLKPNVLTENGRFIGSCGDAFTFAQWNESGDGNDDEYYVSDDADYDLESLFDALDEYSGPYFYFGAHPGDGADYGFWLSEGWEQDARDNDIPIVNDASELPAKYRGEWFEVSDHGNVTLWIKTSRQMREIWSVV